MKWRFFESMIGLLQQKKYMKNIWAIWLLAAVAVLIGAVLFRETRQPPLTGELDSVSIDAAKQFMRNALKRELWPDHAEIVLTTQKQVTGDEYSAFWEKNDVRMALLVVKKEGEQASYVRVWATLPPESQLNDTIVDELLGRIFVRQFIAPIGVTSCITMQNSVTNKPFWRCARMHEQIDDARYGITVISPVDDATAVSVCMIPKEKFFDFPLDYCP
jgi:hypothetical protein